MLRATCLLAGLSGAAALNVGSLARSSAVRGRAVQMSTLADFEATKLSGEAAKLGDFEGKPTLIVNVASL